MDLMDVVYGFLGFIILGVFVNLFFSSRRKNKTRNAFENIPSFSPTQIFCSDDSATGVSVDQSQNKVAFSDQKRKIYVYDFKDIISNCGLEIVSEERVNSFTTHTKMIVCKNP